VLSLRKQPPLAPEVLEEAAEWLMRLSEGGLSDHERAEWERWKVSSPERDRAWARAQLLQSKLGGLPPALAMSALDRPSHPERRAALGKLALLLAVIPVGWGSWKLAQTQQWTADYRTRVGERREWVLADGSRITLNTDSAIDVLFDSQQRLVHLRAGEILVQTVQDASARSWSVPARAACKPWARVLPCANGTRAPTWPCSKAPSK